MSSDRIAPVRRTAPRRRVLKAGAVSFPGGGATCAVYDLSTTGALLAFSTPEDIPDTFDLILEMESRRRHCKIVWRSAKRVGVAFLPD